MIKEKKDEPKQKIEVTKKKRSRSKRQKKTPTELTALPQTEDKSINNNEIKSKSPKKRKLYTPLVEGNCSIRYSIEIIC